MINRDLKIDQQLEDEWGAYAPHVDLEFRKKFVSYLSWLEASLGYHPFHFEEECSWCKKPIFSHKLVYRCYECNTVCHKDCLISHCEESRKCTELRKLYEKQGIELPLNWRDLDPHALSQN